MIKDRARSIETLEIVEFQEDEENSRSRKVQFIEDKDRIKSSNSKERIED